MPFYIGQALFSCGFEKSIFEVKILKLLIVNIYYEYLVIHLQYLENNSKTSKLMSYVYELLSNTFANHIPVIINSINNSLPSINNLLLFSK